MKLDLATLYLVSLLTTAFAGGIFLYTWRQNPAQRAVLWWGVSFLVSASGSFILALEHRLPPLIVHLVGNSAVILSYGLLWTAARHFEHREPLWNYGLAGTALWFVACALPGFANQVTASGLYTVTVLAIYVFATAFEIGRGYSEKLVSRPLATLVLTLFGLLLLSYVPVILTTDIAPAARGDNPLLGAMLLAAYLLWFAILFLLMTLVKERGELRHRVASLRDPLTGGGNRRYFMQEGAWALEKARRARQPSAVVIADLDHFKSINDTFGHATGDAVLQLFAEVARSHLDPDQVFGRLGGEEFGIFLPGSGETEALEITERIRRNFAAKALSVDGFAVSAKVSLGICLAPYSTHQLTEMLAGADSALYEAKNKGRNRVETVSFADLTAALAAMRRVAPGETTEAA
ncbi:GGDEF domain-containing protein [Terrihabitans soli]|uniref:diguanylate cyclase n=1 Tax=Terrihabitans soli TaxID=708113 RepID=A0A6S6QU60_9HYPH|nr:GGDEF domain-containing protein [Terrihabitans soli]BCJ91105.1 GGDEF domain-containing protein [Terrihabitans soli]